MDRFHPAFPHDGHRCLGGLDSRCRLSTGLTYYRYLPWSLRDVHDLSLHKVLAGPVGAGNLRWPGQWPAGVDICGCNSVVFLEKKDDCHRHCSYRKQSGSVIIQYWFIIPSLRSADSHTTAGIVYPIMMRRLFVSMGFPWAVRALAFLMLGCLVICCAIMKLRPRACPSTVLLDFRHFRDPSYMAFVAGKSVFSCYLLMNLPVGFYWPGWHVFLNSFHVNDGISLRSFFLYSEIRSSTQDWRWYGFLPFKHDECYESHRTYWTKFACRSVRSPPSQKPIQAPFSSTDFFLLIL